MVRKNQTFFVAISQICPFTGFSSMAMPLRNTINPSCSCCGCSSMMLPSMMPLKGSISPMRSLPLQAATNEIDLNDVVSELVEYKDQSSVIEQMLKGQKLQTVEDSSIQTLLQNYRNNVKSMNQLRGQFEVLKKSEPKNEQAIHAMQAKLDDIWCSIVLTELFFANTASETKPFAMAQFLFAKKFPTGSAFAKEAAHVGDAHKNENGWITVCMQPQNEEIVIEWVNNNEMSKVTKYAPVIIINCFNDVVPKSFNGNKGQFVDTYIKKDVNWRTVEERLRASSSEGTKKQVDEMVAQSQQQNQQQQQPQQTKSQ
eukprot:MONOS_12809.1-p1 / transcript=MONOS_12809.1 / gene=MONOS_12809 / organism=Monocercomonoides_exilis_PA203 / gene_product=putative Iron/manganese Superoxide dismutase / transcript_product=putative Iron/manganese Superoxide dismutase / location=Mono_scaffold00735:30182-31455(+) / protein_length=313 / sequence_SO=supercontig / SO=protein_coding / is_pseudo=false